MDFVDGRPVRGLFDTGGAGAFVAMRRLVERAGLRPIPDSGRVGVGMLSGDTVVRQRVHFARVGRVAVGALAVDSPRVMTIQGGGCRSRLEGWLGAASPAAELHAGGRWSSCVRPPQTAA